MKKKILHIILITLVFTGQTCKPQKTRQEPEDIIDADPFNAFYYNNKSDYNIDILLYKENVSAPIFILSGFTDIQNSQTIKPGDEKKLLISPVSISNLGLYCFLNSLPANKPDSIRVCFNRAKPDKRYVTYKGKGFKPRDIRNIDEYKYEESAIRFYYTFTNEDYENTIKNQTATPTPIDIECD